jgi:hypothetical protein
MNGDFKRNIDTDANNEAYWKLSDNERESLLSYAPYSAPAVRKEEKVQLNEQQEQKLKKKELIVAEEIDCVSKRVQRQDDIHRYGTFSCFLGQKTNGYERIQKARKLHHQNQCSEVAD